VPCVTATVAIRILYASHSRINLHADGLLALLALPKEQLHRLLRSVALETCQTLDGWTRTALIARGMLAPVLFLVIQSGF
jgi:hypothetical protein